MTTKSARTGGSELPLTGCHCAVHDDDGAATDEARKAVAVDPALKERNLNRCAGSKARCAVCSA